MKVTEKVLELVQALVKEGYTGTAVLTNTYPAGAEAVLGESFSLELTGFCKESLFLTESDGKILAVGRYNVENHDVRTVEDIVSLAAGFYEMYKNYGYRVPGAFESLFDKYGMY